MEAKLIKTDKCDYILIDPTKGVYDKGYLLGTSRESDVNKLSLKNCQAIERGYDLDELAIDEIPDSSSTTLQVQRMRFIHGFQKALEILGDKKFSELTLRECWDTAVYSTALHRNTKEHFGNKEISEEKEMYIQSLQQTEWDVEIEMEEEFIFDPAMGISQGHYIDKPILDADGCLILKRK